MLPTSRHPSLFSACPKEVINYKSSHAHIDTVAKELLISRADDMIMALRSHFIQQLQQWYPEVNAGNFIEYDRDAAGEDGFEADKPLANMLLATQPILLDMGTSQPFVYNRLFENYLKQTPKTKKDERLHQHIGLALNLLKALADARYELYVLKQIFASYPDASQLVRHLHRHIQEHIHEPFATVLQRLEQYQAFMQQHPDKKQPNPFGHMMNRLDGAGRRVAADLSDPKEAIATNGLMLNTPKRRKTTVLGGKPGMFNLRKSSNSATDKRTANNPARPDRTS